MKIPWTDLLSPILPFLCVSSCVQRNIVNNMYVEQFSLTYELFKNTMDNNMVKNLLSLRKYSRWNIGQDLAIFTVKTQTEEHQNQATDYLSCIHNKHPVLVISLTILKQVYIIEIIYLKCKRDHLEKCPKQKHFEDISPYTWTSLPFHSKQYN